MVILAVLGSIGINVGLAYLVHSLAWPFYLDSVMTFWIVARFGFWPGVACAVGTNAILAIQPLGPFVFVICHLATVVGTWLIFRNRERSLILFLMAGLLSALTNGAFGFLISLFAFHGINNVNQADQMVIAWIVAGQSLFSSVFLSEITTNVIDKIISSVLAWWAYQIINPHWRAKTTSS